MPADVSFDVVSEFDRQELVNALDQARREIGTRYDFKGAKAELELGKDEILLRADSDSRARAMRDLLESKAIRRGLSLKIFDWGEIEEAGGNTVRQRVELRSGLPEDLAKKISKLIRDEFPKTKSQIQCDAVRVSGKSKDDLQRVISRLREESEGYPVALQFQNYR
jgi:cyclic-di-GMP-binding protein